MSITTLQVNANIQLTPIFRQVPLSCEQRGLTQCSPFEIGGATTAEGTCQFGSTCEEYATNIYCCTPNPCADKVGSFVCSNRDKIGVFYTGNITAAGQCETEERQTVSCAQCPPANEFIQCNNTTGVYNTGEPEVGPNGQIRCATYSVQNDAQCAPPPPPDSIDCPTNRVETCDSETGVITGKQDFLIDGQCTTIVTDTKPCAHGCTTIDNIVQCRPAPPPTRYDINGSVSTAGGGQINVTTNDANGVTTTTPFATSFTTTYLKGTRVAFSASESIGYTFKEWRVTVDGLQTSTFPNRDPVVFVDGNITAEAVFERISQDVCTCYFVSPTTPGQPFRVQYRKCTATGVTRVTERFTTFTNICSADIPQPVENAQSAQPLGTDCTGNSSICGPAPVPVAPPPTTTITTPTQTIITTPTATPAIIITPTATPAIIITPTPTPPPIPQTIQCCGPQTSYVCETLAGTRCPDGTKPCRLGDTCPPPPPPPTPTPTPPPPTWRSCIDLELKPGTPPPEYVLVTYAPNSVCWEPRTQVAFNPSLNELLRYNWQRGTTQYPETKTFEMVNPSYVKSYDVTFQTNPDVTLSSQKSNSTAGRITLAVPPRGTRRVSVTVTPTLLDKLADGISTLDLRVEVRG